MWQKDCFTFFLTTILAFASAHPAAARQNPAPEKLGFAAVSAGEHAAVDLLLARIVRGLETGDPQLYLGLLAPDYREVPAAAGEAVGVLRRADKAKRRAEGIISSRSELVARLARPMAIPATDFAGRAGRLPDGRYSGTVEAFESSGMLAARVELLFARGEAGWQVTMSDGLSLLARAASRDKAETKSQPAAGFTLLNQPVEAATRTLQERALAPEHGIERLTRQLTEQKLRRRLIGMPGATALYARVDASESAPFLTSTYVQLLTDPAWNRILYGNYANSLQAYDAGESGTPLKRPIGIAVDARGVVYVADAGNSRVAVLALTGEAGNEALLYLGSLGEGELVQPSEVVWDDRGTIFDPGDDVIWVTDRGSKRLTVWQANLATGHRIAGFEGVQMPEKIAIGRFDGRSDGNLYVTDASDHSLHRLFFDGETIHHLQKIERGRDRVVTSLATDHWGHLYLVDVAAKVIEKYTADLQPLATFRPHDASFDPLRFQTLFARLQTEVGQAPRWSGYDQAFLLEQWTANTGGRRFELGLDLNLQQVMLAPELDELVLSGLLTDPGEVSLHLVPAGRQGGEELMLAQWLPAGNFDLRWNRRLASGEMVSPGHYRLRAALRSTYGKQHELVTSAPFYLPLYYFEACGEPGSDSSRLQRGRPRSAASDPAVTLVSDPEEVVYRYHNLDPRMQYEVRASFYADTEVEQMLIAGDVPLHAPVTVGPAVLRTAWLAIPQGTTQGGEMAIRIAKTGGAGDACVAELWLRQADYDPANPPVQEIVDAAVPQAYGLQPNFPNPFNPSTSIDFQIPAEHRGVVTLRIYNMLGQVVRELVNADLVPGSYRRVWNGVDDSGHRVASGVYLYKLQAGSYVATRKLLLMK